MKPINLKAILKCLQSYSGLSAGVFATQSSTEKNFQGCSLGCLYRCSGASVKDIKAQHLSKGIRGIKTRYGLTARFRALVVIANDGFGGSNVERLRFMCIWFRELVKEIRKASKAHRIIDALAVEEAARRAYNKEKAS